MMSHHQTCQSGYTGSVQSYSTGAMNIILPHVMGISHAQLMVEAPTIDDVIDNTRLIVSFGGVSMKNMQINQGGIGNHSARDQLLGIKQKGIDVVCVSPVRADTPEFLEVAHRVREGLRAGHPYD